MKHLCFILSNRQESSPWFIYSATLGKCQCRQTMQKKKKKSYMTRSKSRFFLREIWNWAFRLYVRNHSYTLLKQSCGTVINIYTSQIRNTRDKSYNYHYQTAEYLILRVSAYPRPQSPLKLLYLPLTKWAGVKLYKVY